jgi:hypothetical protein
MYEQESVVNAPRNDYRRLPMSSIGRPELFWDGAQGRLDYYCFARHVVGRIYLVTDEENEPIAAAHCGPPTI